MRVAILGGLLQLLLIPAFVSLGLWQWHKAESKTALQTSLDTRSQDAAIAMPTTPADIETLRHRRVILPAPRASRLPRDHAAAPGKQ